MYETSTRTDEMQSLKMASKPPSISTTLDDFEKMLARLSELTHKASIIGDRVVGAAPTPIDKTISKDEVVQNTLIRRLDDQRRSFNSALNALENYLGRIDAAL